MKRIFTLMSLSICTLCAFGQTAVDFENFGLAADQFLNGSDGTTSFNTDYFSLPIDYNENYDSWTGWALSSVTDNETPGYGNQYSAITGAGVDGSLTYATSYNFGPNTLEMFSPIGGASEFSPNGIYITNATFTYFSMLEGDAFAKKFGGASGTDPDFLLLTIKGLNKEGQQDSVDFYLADYRFEDSNQDYIIDEWTFVDLTKFAAYENLQFQITSSDVGQFGINTPQYFCIDNVVFDVTTSTEDEAFSDLSVYPNPASEILNIEYDGEATIKITNGNGALVLSQTSLKNRVNISELPTGVYALLVTSKKGNATRRFVKI